MFIDCLQATKYRNRPRMYILIEWKLLVEFWLLFHHQILLKCISVNINTSKRAWPYLAAMDMNKTMQFDSSLHALSRWMGVDVDSCVNKYGRSCHGRLAAWRWYGASTSQWTIDYLYKNALCSDMNAKDQNDAKHQESVHLLGPAIWLWSPFAILHSWQLHLSKWVVYLNFQ